MENETNLIDFSEAPEDVAQKILDVLALAENEGSAPGERENALVAAKKLAHKYRIDLLTVDKSNLGVMRSKDEFTQETFKSAKGRNRRPPCNKYLVYILQDHFNVKVIYSGSTLHLIGRKSAVKFAMYVYKFLHRTFLQLWREESTTRGTPTSLRDTFFTGLWIGLDKKLTASSKEVENKSLKERAKERGVDVSSLEESYSLLVISEEERLKQEVANRHPVVTYSKNRGRGVQDRALFNEAVEKGRNIEIAMPLANSSSQGLDKGVEKISESH